MLKSVESRLGLSLSLSLRHFLMTWHICTLVRVAAKPERGHLTVNAAQELDDARCSEFRG